MSRTTRTRRTKQNQSDFSDTRGFVRHLGDVTTLIGFMVGLLTSGIAGTVWFTKNITTSDQLQTSVEALKKYADKADEIVLEKAYDKADKNMRENQLRIESVKGEIGSVSVKADMILNQLNSIQQTQQVQSLSSTPKILTK